MESQVGPWRCWSIFNSAEHPYEGSQVRYIAQREAETAHARPRLYELPEQWRSLSPVKGSHSVPKNKISVLE